MNCWMSYSVGVSPARTRRPISAKPSMMTLELVGGLAVRVELLGTERGLELLDEVGAGDDRDGGHRADELDRAGVHARDVRDVVVGRVLHGYLAQQHALVLEAAGGERVAHGAVQLL